ncbi:hypothetical protein O1611_g5145 [Lasiodiplodia mahajangana]|uniref:Uncharacterized protein n=1 Tax=Lasiodiplodia mahajangana TaxID=1108764 RepID=A0ACC2JM10_9PEZI|nr:hypothetical protein O1611_g5145 [Lasiodiplodia mahajangana]
MRPPVTDIQAEHLFARFAFVILSEPNYRFLWGDWKCPICLFNPVRGEQYITELHSDAITQHDTLSDEGARERRLDDDDDGSSSEASSDISDEKDNWPRGRSGRPSYVATHQEQRPTQGMDEIQDIPMLQRSSSVGRTSEPSPDTPQPGPGVPYDNNRGGKDSPRLHKRRRPRWRKYASAVHTVLAYMILLLSLSSPTRLLHLTGR